MKKYIWLLLALLLCAGVCEAESGNLYDGEIRFAGVPLGVTGPELEEMFNACHGEYFRITVNEKDVEPFRSHVDAIFNQELYYRRFTNKLNTKNGMASSSISSQHKGGVTWKSKGMSVAGYQLDSLNAYCSYPIENGDFVREADKSVFYLGRYNFETFEKKDVPAVFSDLKSKLTVLYGKPYMEASDPRVIWGEAEFIGYAARYDGDIQQRMEEDYKGFGYGNEENYQYVVWKAAGSGAEVILQRNGTTIRISYYLPSGDVQWLDENALKIDHDNMTGL